MLKTFFSSKTRVKIIRLFVNNPEGRYYLREIAKVLDEPITPIRRELINLKKVGLLEITPVANLIFYHLNADFLLYEELKGMVEKTEKLEIY